MAHGSSKGRGRGRKSMLSRGGAPNPRSSSSHAHEATHAVEVSFAQMLNHRAIYRRSDRGHSNPWVCAYCNNVNYSVQRRLFHLPAFNCNKCGRDFFLDNDLDFSMADIKVNDISLVPNIMHQEGPHCYAYAACQMMRMRYLLDTAVKNKIPDDELLDLFDPAWMIDKYERKYQKYKKKAPHHRMFKLWESLRSDGIELSDGSVYKIGDVSLSDSRNYKGICEMLANGEPVLGSLHPGAGFRRLRYGQFYHSPQESPAVRYACGQLPPGHSHARHTVVLVGPKTNHKTGDKGFWFVNSWKNWCRRENYVISNDNDIVKYGVGLIAHESITSNVVRFWQPGEQTAPNDPMRLQKEPEDNTINRYNYELMYP